METRNLGTTGAQVSAVGFGAWAIGGGWGAVPEDDAMDALHAAVDHGMTFIDTADVYGEGRSERLIGRLLRERDEPLLVATKMGRLGDWNASYDAMAGAAEASRRRLGVDALDLVQLHCIPFATLQAGRVFEHLERLKSEGLIRHYGASVETVDEALFCIRESGCETLQVIFNIFRQKLIDELFPSVRSSGIGIIARVPLASGLLSGKFPPDHQFAADDHRNFNANGERFNVGETFAGIPFARGIELAREVENTLGGRPDASMAQLALRWILDHPEVSTVIPGAKSRHQTSENAAAAELPPLDDESHRRLRALYQSRIAAEIRGAY